MKLGVMQPYLFPYIGYFQLINAVDRFVVYDDVTYIKQGWINRNKILLNGKEHIFTVPLKNASSFITIRNTEINDAQYGIWCNKFLKTLEQAYSKAPNYDAVYNLVATVLKDKHTNICDLATKSITDTFDYLGITTEFVITATHYNNNSLKAQDRIIDICKKERADTYINAIGGKELYDKDTFEKSGVMLNFIRPHNIIYPQFGNEYVPWLSVIDVMMFNTPETIQGFLKECSFE